MSKLALALLGFLGGYILVTTRNAGDNGYDPLRQSGSRLPNVNLSFLNPAPVSSASPPTVIQLLTPLPAAGIDTAKAPAQGLPAVIGHQLAPIRAALDNLSEKVAGIAASPVTPAKDPAATVAEVVKEVAELVTAPVVAVPAYVFKNLGTIEDPELDFVEQAKVVVQKITTPLRVDLLQQNFDVVGKAGELVDQVQRRLQLDLLTQNFDVVGKAGELVDQVQRRLQLDLLTQELDVVGQAEEVVDQVTARAKEAASRLASLDIISDLQDRGIEGVTEVVRERVQGLTEAVDLQALDVLNGDVAGRVREAVTQVGEKAQEYREAVVENLKPGGIVGFGLDAISAFRTFRRWDVRIGSWVSPFR